MTKPLIPNPLNSDAEYSRFNFLDILELDDTELTDELNCLRVLLWGLNLDHWLRRRVAALEHELISRKYKKR